jgi:hypothetical protein
MLPNVCNPRKPYRCDRYCSTQTQSMGAASNLVSQQACSNSCWQRKGGGGGEDLHTRHCGCSLIGRLRPAA